MRYSSVKSFTNDARVGKSDDMSIAWGSVALNQMVWLGEVHQTDCKKRSVSISVPNPPSIARSYTTFPTAANCIPMPMLLRNRVVSSDSGFLFSAMRDEMS